MFIVLAILQCVVSGLLASTVVSYKENGVCEFYEAYYKFEIRRCYQLTTGTVSLNSLIPLNLGRHRTVKLSKGVVVLEWSGDEIKNFRAKTM